MAKLTILTGKSAGQAYNFTRSIHIGRGLQNDLVIKNPTISTVHAEIVLRDQQSYLRDLGSTNGTSINGAQLKAHSYVLLNHGDQVSFANYAMRFEQAQVLQERSTVSGQFAVERKQGGKGDRSSSTVQVCGKCGQPRRGNPPICGCTPRNEPAGQQGPAEAGAGEYGAPVTVVDMQVPANQKPGATAAPFSSGQVSAARTSTAAADDLQHAMLWGGILAVLLGILWFGISLALGVLFFFPVVLVAAGGYAIYRGVSGR